MKAPGISDLDLVVVVDDAALAGGLPLLPLDAQEARIMVHPPLIVPHSLFADLAWYHPVQIEWAAGGDRYPQPGFAPEVSLLHVIEKTRFVETRLRAAGLADTSLRSLFLMLTSLARSIEWIGRAEVAVEPREAEYAQQVLALRSAWIDDPRRRGKLQPALEEHLALARGIAADLTERVAARLLERDEATPGPGAVLQERPLRFVHRGQEGRGAPAGGRPRWSGEHRTAGPLLFSLLLARCGIEMELGAIDWPLHVGNEEIRRAVEDLPAALRSTLDRYCRVNLEYYRVLSGAGLSAAYFGTAWRTTGWRRLVKLALSRVLR